MFCAFCVPLCAFCGSIGIGFARAQHHVSYNRNYPSADGVVRFPGKPLARILGRPMIEHIFRRAAMCDILDAVYIATCDEEIRRVAEGFGAPVLMTSSTHERASDRVAEAAASLGADIVVMIQGDEPMITPGMIASAVAPMIEDDSVRLVNLTRRIGAWEEYVDRNTIKVVMDVNWNALYFSRAPIPTLDSAGVERGEAFKQVCVIPFRHDFLHEFARLPQT